MSVTMQYLLQQEKEEEKRKQEAIPGVAPVTTKDGMPDPEEVNPAQVQSPQEQYPLAHQANEEVQRQANVPAYADEFPNVYDAQQQMQVAQPEQEGIQPQEVSPESFLGGEHVEALRTAGFTDEEISSLGQSPDPQSFLNGIATRSYRQSMPEPDAPDEKKMRRQQSFAAISDVLGLFSQAAGAAQGAHVRERKFEEGAMARLSENQQKLYNRYLKQADNYNRGLVNASMQDYMQGHRDWKDTEKEMRKSLETSRKEKISEAKQLQKDAIEREKMDNANRKLDAYIQDSDRRLRVQERNAATQATRAATYDKRAEAWISKMEGENTNSKGKKYDYEVMIPAHPDDKDAFMNDSGELVTIIGVSKAEKEYIAKQAMQDAGFIASLEQEDRALAAALLNGSANATQRNLAVDIYLQQRYNKANGIKNGIAISDATGKYDRGRGAPPPVQTGDGSSVNELADPIETTMQQVQDANDEMNPDDEFEIIGTI